jgi:hypothetical protein
MNMKELKRRFVREILAYEAMLSGDWAPAVDVIQMGLITKEQARYGITERLKSSYSYFTYLGKAPADVMGAASNLLSGGRLPHDTILALIDRLEAYN